MKQELCFQLLNPTSKRWEIYKKIFNKVDKAISKLPIKIHKRTFDDEHFQMVEIVEYSGIDIQVSAVNKAIKILYDANLQTELIYNKNLSGGNIFTALNGHDIADCMKAINDVNKKVDTFIKLMTETTLDHNLQTHTDILDIYNVLGQSILPDISKNQQRTTTKFKLDKPTCKKWKSYVNLLPTIDKQIKKSKIKLITRFTDEHNYTVQEVFDYDNEKQFLNLALQLRDIVNPKGLFFTMIHRNNIKNGTNKHDR